MDFSSQDQKNYAVLNARLKKQYRALVREIDAQKDALFHQDLKRLEVAQKWLKFAQEHAAERQQQQLLHPFVGPPVMYAPACVPAVVAPGCFTPI